MENYFQPELSRGSILEISSIGLAHMGDAVFELLVRAWLCAPAEKILPLLTEEERAVFRRGRNAQVHTVPHHASRAQYGEATALEALLGWLYLQGRLERINQLFCIMMEEEAHGD